MNEMNSPSAKKRFTISSLFRNNRFVAIFSVVCAVIIWFAVSVAFNPIVEKTVLNIPIQIPLETTTLENLKAYEGADATVSVKVQGKKYVVDQLGADDLTVTASLNGVVGVGTYRLELSAKSAVGLTDYDVVSVSPASVTVTFDNEAVKTFDVEVKCPGLSADGDYGSDSIVMVDSEMADESYSTLTVIGAASQVNQIDHVAAVSDVTETLQESKQVTARIMMYDVYDELLYDAAFPEDSRISLTELQFTEVPVIARVNMVRDLPLKVNYRNAPETLPNVTIAEKNDTALTTVTSVRVKGAVETISAMSEVVLDGNFDFMSLDPNDSSSWYKDMTLPVLSGVKYFDYANVKDAAFRVMVAPDDMKVKTYDLVQSNITVANTTYSVSVESTLKGIQVIGPPQALRSLSAEEIVATIDANGLVPGTYTLKPTFQISTQKKCWVAGSYEITIRLS